MWHTARSTAICYYQVDIGLDYCSVVLFVFERTYTFPPPPVFYLAYLTLQEIVPIMDLAVNEEFTRMYSEEELMGARRIQARLRLPLPVVSWFSVLPRC